MLQKDRGEMTTAHVAVDVRPPGRVCAKSFTGTLWRLPDREGTRPIMDLKEAGIEVELTETVAAMINSIS